MGRKFGFGSVESTEKLELKTVNNVVDDGTVHTTEGGFSCERS